MLKIFEIIIILNKDLIYTKYFQNYNKKIS